MATTTDSIKFQSGLSGLIINNHFQHINNSKTKPVLVKPPSVARKAKINILSNHMKKTNPVESL
jgi:hypothetical protein